MKERRLRILLVDDDRDDYLITRDLLSEVTGTGFDVEWVATYDAALEALDRLAPGDRALAERVGEDARVLASEVQKLVAYAGDRAVIGAADVEAVVVRVAADPFFALGNAVEARDLAQALAVLDRSLADGASLFLVLGSLAGTVRRLVAERERGRRAAGERRIGSYDEWQRAVLPSISEEELGAKKPYGFWMKYQAAMRFTRAELLGALADLSEADVAMKSGLDGRLRLERVLLGLLAPETAERNAS